MKLIFAVVNKDDSSAVSGALTKEGFTITKLATTGGFLLAGNTTFLIGVEDDKVDEVLEIIKKYSKKRAQMVPASPTFGLGMPASVPFEVIVGGATVFVTDVSRFEKY